MGLGSLALPSLAMYAHTTSGGLGAMQTPVDCAGPEHEDTADTHSGVGSFGVWTRGVLSSAVRPDL